MTCLCCGFAGCCCADASLMQRVFCDNQDFVFEQQLNKQQQQAQPPQKQEEQQPQQQQQ